MWYQIEETEKYDITVKKSLKVYDYFKISKRWVFHLLLNFFFQFSIFTN